MAVAAHHALHPACEGGTACDDDPQRVIADALAVAGWHVCADYISPALTSQLAADVQPNLAQGRFRPAGTGAGVPRLRPDVRGDSILWLDRADASEPQREVLDRFEQLRQALNRELQLGLFDFECHYAVYPAGAFYRRHLDRVAGDSSSVLSCVLYLNRDWGQGDGGALRLHLPGDCGHLDIAPRGGTLVTFLSERFEHQVLPAARQRVSLTGWFRRRA